MVFSMMHLLGVTIEVDYKRTLEELVYDIVDKAPTPAWLTIGYDIPVDPKSGLIPILPTFTPNSLPTYTVDGTLQLASNIVQNDNLCYKFDLVMLSSSVTDGHMACMCAMDVKSASKPTQSPNSNGFLETELSLSHAEYELSIRCRFRGRIGTAVAVVGKSISKRDDFWQPDSEQGQFVLLLGKDDDQVWRKSGAGYLDIPATDRIERRHLRVGGGPGAEFQACDCGKEMRRQQRMQKRSAKDPKELLKEACMAQDENAIRRLLDMGVELNGNDQEASILEDACHWGNERIIQLLLDHGADPNFQREGGGCPLQSACWSGNASAARVLLKAGADANAGDEADGNALQIAVLADHIEIVRLLLQHGADVNAQGGSHGNSLTAAADRGLKEMVELLIANGANVNSPGRGLLSSPLITGFENCDEPSSEDGHESVNYNWTPLQAAAAGGHNDVVRILLENGADVNAQTDRFGSALQAACQEGQVDVVRLLIEHGARVSDQGGLYGNALQAAAAGTSIPVMRLLIEKGADVNAAGGFHGSALLAAAARRGPERDSTDAMLFLIESGADIDYRGGPFGHVLAAAAHAYNYSGVQMLIEHGADVNARGGKFGSVIQAAAQVDDRHIVRLLKGKGASDPVQEKDSYEEVIRRLVRKGANVNEIGGRYGTVLQAVSCGEYNKSLELLSRYKNVPYMVDVTPAEQERVVQLLLKNGSQVNACGGYHGTALQAASCVGNIRVAKLLIKKGAKVNAIGGYHGTALQAACRHGHEPVVRLLLANGAQVNAQGGVYGNALLAAAFHSTRMAELLVRNGADVHGDEPQGRSLLHIAAATGNCDMMKRGVENGLDANRKDRQGRTILHHAAASGSLEAVKQAVGYCSSVTARDADGWTPLHWAAKRGDTRVVKALMDAGARNSVQTKQGWTPYRVAVLHKSLAAAVLLAEHQSLTQGALAIVVEDEQQQLAMGYRHEGVICDGCQLVSQRPHSNLPPAEACCY
jgi:ankyrin repeat protein